MKIVGDEKVLVEKVAGGLVDNEFFVEAVAVRCLVICLGDVFEGYRLRTVGCADPVGVGKVDADWCGRVGVAGEDGGGDHLGAYTFHFVFAETGIDGRVLLEPFGVA